MLSSVDPKLFSYTYTYLLVVLDATQDKPQRYKVIRIEHKKQEKEVTPTEHEYLCILVLDTNVKCPTFELKVASSNVSKDFPAAKFCSTR